MAGPGRLGPRGGKRPSSSSYCTVTTVAFVAFFLLAVWVFSSSSFVHSSTRTGGAAVRSRASLSSAYFRSTPSVLLNGSSEEGEKVGEEEAEGAVDEEPPVGVVSEGLEIRREAYPGSEGTEKEGSPDERKEEERQLRQQQQQEEQQQRHHQQHQEERQRHQQQQQEEERQRHQQQQQEEERQRHQQQQQEEERQRHRQQQQEEEQRHQQQQQQDEEQRHQRQQRQEEEQRHQHQHQQQQQEEEQRHQQEEEEEEQRRQQQQQQEQEEDDVLSQQYQKSEEEANGDLPLESEGEQSQETGMEQEERQPPDPTFDEEVNREGHEKAGDESVNREEDDPSETHDPQNEGEAGYLDHHRLQNPYSTENKETELPSHQELKDAEEQEESPSKIEKEEEGNEVVHLRRETEESVKDSQAAAEELASETDERKTPPWTTQEDQSQDEKERQKELLRSQIRETKWALCNVTAGADYIPCLDNTEALRHIPTRHYEHRERHCPEESPSCLVPLPQGYRRPVEWPRSRDKIWYKNVPHTKLAVVKGHQNWVKVSGEYLTFPGGGTQFIHGALHYIDFIQRSVRNISWGKRTRVVLDVGCGVASFGGYLFERDVLAMSFAPKDEHEAQVQFALERGIPAISAVMGSQRLPFPSKVFDLIHCARCRVPWHAEGGALLLELNRLLRPGGYFVWSATPVYQKLKDDVEIWRAMMALTKSMCWELVTIRKDRLNSVGAAFFRKPISNECYDSRQQKAPPLCREDDDPDVAWYVSLQSCMHRVPTEASERGSRWPEEWPRRLRTPPHWLNSSKLGVYGKPAPDDFTADYEHWKRVVSMSYLAGLGIEWPKVRNAMDMRAVYGGFAAVLKDLKIWVMNVVDVDSPETLPIIYERGLFGIYHDWCESFSTYPRTYDLLHADKLFSTLKQRCSVIPVVVEVDRILRPGGKLIVRDEQKVVSEVEDVLRSLHWEVPLTFSMGREGILCAEKSDWRPPETLRSSS